MIRLWFYILFVFAGLASLANGALAKEYCADGGITIERPDFSTQEMVRRCQDAASLFGWKAIFGARSCTICALDQVRNATLPVKPGTPTGGGTTVSVDQPPMPPLPAGLGTVGTPTSGTSCQTNYPGKLYDPFVITIDNSTIANCPAPYITSGWNRDYSPKLRKCAYCGAGYKSSQLKWGCCEQSKR